MSEKLKPNFTAIPNVIFDKFMCKLAPGAAKVLFAICRFTYGYGKPNGDHISLKQLQDMTGMARGSVARSVKELDHLVTVTPGDPSRQMASQYRLNIEIPDAELVSLSNQHLVSKRDQASLLASRIKRPSKENPKKKKPPDSFFPIIEKIIGRMNELSGKPYQTDSKALCKFLRARLNEGKTEDECLAVVEDRWARWGDSEKMREHFNPTTIFREENFPRYLVEATANASPNARSTQTAEWRKEIFVNA